MRRAVIGQMVGDRQLGLQSVENVVGQVGGSNEADSGGWGAGGRGQAVWRWRGRH